MALDQLDRRLAIAFVPPTFSDAPGVGDRLQLAWLPRVLGLDDEVWAGEYRVYVGAAGQAIDYDRDPDLTIPADQTDCDITFPSLTPGAIYRVGVTAVDSGVESEPVEMLIVGGSGGGPAGMPPPVSSLRAARMAAGVIALTWNYVNDPHGTEPDTFEVYANGGGGEISFAAAVATVTATATTHSYRLEYSAGSGLGWMFAVRAACTSGAASLPVACGPVAADAVGPAPLATPTATAEQA